MMPGCQHGFQDGNSSHGWQHVNIAIAKLVGTVRQWIDSSIRGRLAPPSPSPSPDGSRRKRDEQRTTRRSRAQRELVDPPHAATRDLTEDEKQIVSASGWLGANQGLPHGETDTSLWPLKMRGSWPRPGWTEQMLRSDPAVYSGFERQQLTVGSINWDIVPPPDTTDEERFQTAWIESGYRRLPAGFLGHAVLRPFTSRLHGFSVTEKVYAIDEQTGLWRLDGLHWIAPWTVKAWILDDSTGYAIGILLRDERGERVIWWESVMYAGQMFWGRNYEGVGICRPLKYYWDHKRQIIIDDAVARERASSGIPYGQAPPGVDAQTFGSDFAYVETVLNNILYSDDDTPPHYIAPNGWTLGVNYLEGMPDSTPMLRYLDHQIAQQMTDTLSQLGVSEHGARAVGAEQRVEKWSMLGGMCAIMAHNIDHSIHRQVYDLNGWNTDRMCRTVAEGVQNVEMYRRLLEFLTTPVPENPVIEVTDEMKASISRALGLRA